MKSLIQAKPLSVVVAGGYFEDEQFNSSIKKHNATENAGRQ